MEKLVEKRSLSRQVADRLRDYILALEVKPGSRLRVDELADRLRVSRTPVREGLQYLTARGLVVRDGSNYSVVEFTERDVTDLFALRRALEPLAAHRAARRMTPEAQRQLGALCGEEREAPACLTAYVQADVRFHNLIAEISGNGRLRDLIERYSDQHRLVRHWLCLPGWNERDEPSTRREHARVIEKLAAGDPDGAAAALLDHLCRGEARTLEWFRR